MSLTKMTTRLAAICAATVLVTAYPPDDAGAASDTFCKEYAARAAAQHFENQRRGCGFSGVRWTDNQPAAFIFCKAAGRSASNSETNQRENMLRQCRIAQGAGQAGGNAGNAQQVTCKPDAVRGGGRAGNQTSAEKVAKSYWARNVADRYGLDFSNWRHSRSRKMECKQNPEGDIGCFFTARPCNGQTL